MRTRGRVRPAYLVLFASLYALQGVVVAYFFNYNQIYMQAAGVARDHAAGVQSLALAPFLLKFLAGPLSDRYSPFGLGHRKPYIVLGLGLQSLSLAALSAIEPARHLAGFAAVATLAVAGMALYDTSCDGMVIDATPTDGRARVQGVLVGSRCLAAMAFSYGFGFWLDAAGTDLRRFHHVLWACAALGLVPLLQCAWLAEPPRAVEAERFQWAALRALVRPRALTLLAFGALYSVVGYGVEINLGPYYKARRFSEADIGSFAALRYLGRALGAALMPLSLARLGRGRTLTTGVVALAVATAAQSARGGWSHAAAAALAFGAVNGWDDALFFMLAMEASDPRMAASTYALFMAVTNVSVAGGWLVARGATLLGGRLEPAFLAAALVSLATLPMVPYLSRPATTAEHSHGGS